MITNSSISYENDVFYDLCDEKGILVAILSDGDLRRALMREDFTMDTLALSYATKHPKTLNNAHVLASEALALIESYKIQLLAITNSAGALEGVLHIHQLVEAGIK